MVCALTYTDQKALVGGALAQLCGAEAGFRLCSLYDTDYVGIGHQPYFFDTLSQIYLRYRVTACTVDLTFTDPDVDGIAVVAQVKPNDATGGATNLVNQTLDAVRERPNCVVGFLNNTGVQKLHVRRRFLIHEAEGMTKTEFAGQISEYGALCTTNPTRTTYLQIAIAGFTAPGVKCNCAVKLEFEAEFYERNIVGQS